MVVAGRVYPRALAHRMFHDVYSFFPKNTDTLHFTCSSGYILVMSIIRGVLPFAAALGALALPTMKAQTSFDDVPRAYLNRLAIVSKKIKSLRSTRNGQNKPVRTVRRTWALQTWEARTWPVSRRSAKTRK